MGYSNNIEYSKIEYSKMDLRRDQCRYFACLLFLLGILVAGFTVMSSMPPFDGSSSSCKTPVCNSPPPPHEEAARMCRYIVHVSDWLSMSTTSTHAGIIGYPFVNVFSMADGTVGNSTGVPYLFLTALELSVHDLKKDPRASMTMSLAQTDYCRMNNLDQQDPVCAHVILTGEIERLAANSTEEAVAREGLFSRHPEMKIWPEEHKWFFAKLDIRHIYVLDYFGGAVVVPLEEYFAATPY